MRREHGVRSGDEGMRRGGGKPVRAEVNTDALADGGDADDEVRAAAVLDDLARRAHERTAGDGDRVADREACLHNGFEALGDG